MIPLISQAMPDGDFSHTEFHKVLEERQNYWRLKVEINDQTRTKIKEINCLNRVEKRLT